MKRIASMLVLVLAVTALFGGVALAEESEDGEEVNFEFTGGEIELDTTLFNRFITQEEDWDEAQTEDEIINFAGATGLEAEFVGTAFNQSIDWNLGVEEQDVDQAGIYDYNTSLAFTKENDESLAEVTFYNGLNSPTFKGRKRVGNAEGQTVVAPWNDGNVSELAGDTYIKYYMLDDNLNLTFKPFAADLAIGDEFEYGGDEFDIPGFEMGYQLSDELSLTTVFATDEAVSNFKADRDGAKDYDEFKRDFKTRGEFDYEGDSLALTLAGLVDYQREMDTVDTGIEYDDGSTYGYEWNESGSTTNVSALIDEAIDTYTEAYSVADFKFADRSYVLNLMSDYELGATTLDFEVDYALGSYTREYSDDYEQFEIPEYDEESEMTDIKLQTRITQKLGDTLELSLTYNLENTVGDYSQDREDSYERGLTRTAHAITPGVEQEIEEGLFLTTDLSYTLSTVELEWDEYDGDNWLGGAEEEWNFSEVGVNAGVRYEF